MEELSSKMRNQVKKSLKTYDIRKISADEMLEIGFPIFQAALANYKVKAESVSEKSFNSRIYNKARLLVILIFGVYMTKRLIRR